MMLLRVVLFSLCVVCCFSLPASKSEEEYDDKYMHPRRSETSGVPRPNPHLEEDDAEFWRIKAQNTLAEHLAREPVITKARNAILFLGDGMSIPTITSARIFGKGEQGEVAFDKFPYVGLSRTYCIDTMVADSACSATAYLTGVKANMGTMGVSGAVKRYDCLAMQNTTNHVDSILRMAQLEGKATGIVTSTRVTHASPGGGYAHVANRDWETDDDVSFDGEDPEVCDDIAEQLVRGETGRNLNVILGGGRANFRPSTSRDEENAPGRRNDGVDLIEEWKIHKDTLGVSNAYVWDLDTLKAVDLTKTDYILGLFEPSHLKYNVDNDPTKKPTLAELTKSALTVLGSQPNGFVLFVEGGRIDHAHHETKAQIALDETLQFAAAIEMATSILDPEDTLIVVTSDHAHTMSVSGYPTRGSDITGIADISDEDSKPYSILSYANGPGYKSPGPDGSRYDISSDDLADPYYEFPALAPLSSETHGGDDVAVFARGPWAHLFTGTYEQNFIQHAMCYATCLGTGLSACAIK